MVLIENFSCTVADYPVYFAINLLERTGPEGRFSKPVKDAPQDFFGKDDLGRIELARSSFSLTGRGGICFINSGMSFKLHSNNSVQHFGIIPVCYIINT